MKINNNINLDVDAITLIQNQIKTKRCETISKDLPCLIWHKIKVIGTKESLKS